MDPTTRRTKAGGLWNVFTHISTSVLIFPCVCVHIPTALSWLSSEPGTRVHTQGRVYMCERTPVCTCVCVHVCSVCSRVRACCPVNTRVHCCAFTRTGLQPVGCTCVHARRSALLEPHQLCSQGNNYTLLATCAHVCARVALTTEMLASPKAGVVPALQITPSPWQTPMAEMRVEGRVAAFTSLSPLPHAAAATSQKKAKQTVTQKSCQDERPGSAAILARRWLHMSRGMSLPYCEGELRVFGVQGMEAEVEHQSRHGVEEGEDPQGHEKLGGSGEITNEVQGAGFCFILTIRHPKGNLV